MKKVFGKKQKNLKITIILMMATFIVFFAELFLFSNNAFASASTVEYVRDSTFWNSAGDAIGEFYTQTYELVMCASGKFAWNANYMFSAFTDTLLGIGFLIWLTGFIGINVFASVTNASITKIIPAVLIRGLIVMSVATILEYNGNNANMPLFKEILRPFVISAYNLSADYLGSNTYIYSDFNYTNCKTAVQSYTDTSPVLPGTVSAERAAYLGNMKPADQNMFTADMVLYGGCLLRQVAHSVSSIGVMGTAMIIDSTDVHFIIFMHVLEFIAGVCICISCFWLLLMVPVYLLDAVWKLVIFSACFPILFVLWAFPLTRDYFMRGFFLFVHSCLHVVFMCIILGFCIKTMGLFANDLGIFTVVANGDQMSDVKDTYANFAKAGFTALLIMPWMTVIMVEKAEGFADFFCGDRASGLDASANAFRSARTEASGKALHYTPKVLAMEHKRKY